MSNFAIAIIITTNHRIKSRQINEKKSSSNHLFHISNNIFAKITPTY